MYMEYTLLLCGRELSYCLTRKKVKNINLRISPDGKISVSAPKSISLARIEAFLQSWEQWICQALEKIESQKVTLPEGCTYLCGQPVQIPNGEDELKWLRRQAERLLPAVYEQAWQSFAKDGFAKPALRLRKMKSRWGSCIPSKGVITLNSLLVCAPPECQLAVCAHELSHMLEPNHSRRFYQVLEAHCPDYRIWQEKLEEVRPFLVHLW